MAQREAKSEMSLLEVEDLRVSFTTEDGVVSAVDGVSFEVEPGETLGIVGESGSGKSVTAMTILGLTRVDNASASGAVRFGGKDLLTSSEDELETVRGDQISMIFQDPLSSLHPFFRVGDQLIEAVRTHQDASKREAESRAADLLGLVGVPDPKRRLRDFPHEFSGGMRQRAMIAMALANDPKLLIADEPTTALDVTTQAQIIALLDRLQSELDMAVILITHDLGVVAEVTERVLVMYAGRVVEEASVDQLFHDPQHPYTWGLLGSLTRLDQAGPERLSQIGGAPPSLLAPPEGCHFRPRCPHAFDRCTEVPPLEARVGEPGHRDRCWLGAGEKRELRTVEGRIALNQPGDADPETPASIEAGR